MRGFQQESQPGQPCRSCWPWPASKARLTSLSRCSEGTGESALSYPPKTARLKLEAPADLHRARSARAEHLSCAIGGLPERERLRCACRRRGIDVEVVAAEIGNIEDVE